MRHYSVDDIYQLLIDLGMFTRGELDLLTYVNGFNFDTLEDALYCRYGYRSIEQFIQELDEEEGEEWEE